MLSSSHLCDVLLLLQNGQLDSLPLGQRDERRIGRVPNQKDILLSGRERLSLIVAKRDDVEGAGMLLHMKNGPHAPTVSALGNHRQLADLELDKLSGLSGGDVDLDHIIDFDQRVGVANGASIMRHNQRNLLLRDLLALHSAELELLLLIGDSVEEEFAHGVIHKTERIGRFWDFHHIHKASGEVGVGADLPIHLDVLLHADHLGFLAGEGVLESVSKDEHEGKRLS